MSRVVPCECGFWDRDRPHSGFGGGNCKYAYARRTGRVDHTGDITLPDEVVDLKLLLECRAENKRLRKAHCRLQQMVDAQALDEGLWFGAETAAEAYLQQELRKLHAVVESAALEGE